MNLNFDGLAFPIKITDISKFEALNEISENLFGLKSSLKDGKSNCEIVGPLHFTKNERNRHCYFTVCFR